MSVLLGMDFDPEQNMFSEDKPSQHYCVYPSLQQDTYGQLVPEPVVPPVYSSPDYSFQAPLSPPSPIAESHSPILDQNITTSPVLPHSPVLPQTIPVFSHPAIVSAEPTLPPFTPYYGTLMAYHPVMPETPYFLPKPCRTPKSNSTKKHGRRISVDHPNMTPEEKKAKEKRRKNVAAVLKCRRKKKMEEKRRLEQGIQKAAKRNAKLTSAVEKVKKEIKELKNASA